MPAAFFYRDARSRRRVVAFRVVRAGRLVRGERRGDRPVERAEVAVHEQRRICDDVRVRVHQGVRPARQEGEGLAAAGHAYRVGGAEQHDRPFVEEDDVHVAEGVDLARDVLERAVLLHAIADDERADAQAREPRGVARLERGHDAVESADGLGRHERDGVAHGPRHVEQRLERFVARPTPVLARERTLGEKEGARALCMGIEEVRRVLPVLRHRLVRPARQEPARERRACRCPHHQRHGHQRRRALPRVAPAA